MMMMASSVIFLMGAGYFRTFSPFVKYSLLKFKTMATSQNKSLTASVENTSLMQESPPSPHAFDLHLVDTNTLLIKAWEKELSKLSGNGCLKIQIHHEPFQSLLETKKVDCMVSPANSFGLMDGGLDLYISQYYGGVDELVPVVQKEIEKEWCGEQNVGTCMLVDLRDLIKKLTTDQSSESEKKNFPIYLAHCPTMRTPKDLDLYDDIVYRCTWAILTSIRKHNAKVLKNPNGKHERINSVICAGFGTGVGCYPEITCAKQMILAVKNFVEAPAIDETKRDSSSNSNRWGKTWLIQWSYARRIENSIKSLFRKEHK